MKIENTHAEDLRQDFCITIDKADFDRRCEVHLNQKGATTKIEGFRPGKIPLSILKIKFGDQATRDAKDSIVQEADTKVREDTKMERALKGFYTEKDDASAYVFELSYDIAPEFEIQSIEGCTFDDIKVDVPEDTIEDRITLELEHDATKEDVPEDQPISVGNDVGVCLTLLHEGKILAGYDQRKLHLIVGKHRDYLDALEDKLVGMKKGESGELTLRFDTTHPDENLADKECQLRFAIECVHKITKAELDDVFAKRMGSDSLDAYRARVKQHVYKPFKVFIDICIKRQILDTLAENYTFALPERLVQREFDYIWQQVQSEIEEAKAAGETLAEIEGKTEDELRQEYRDVAERRVRLGFVISQIAEQHHLAVTENDLRQAILEEAFQDPEKAHEVLDYYRNNPRAIESLRLSRLENLVIHFIRETAQKNEMTLSVDELKNRFSDILPGMLA